jgi:HEAT repeat protein
LAKIKHPWAVESLVARLGDEHQDVRAAAANALGIIKDLRAVLPLIAALGDDAPFVRFNAARALGEIKNPLAVSPLVASFKEDNVSEVRWGAAHALGEIRDARAVRPLADNVAIQDSRTMGPFTDVLDVRESLRAIEHSLAVVIKGMHWSIQLEAIRSLGKIGEEALPSLISTMLNHQDLEFRKEAAEKIMDIKGVQFVIDVLKDDNSLEVIREVHGYVIAVGECDTEDVLIGALNAYGEINMARDFLGSKNLKLEKAAETWMKSKGYKSLSEKPKTGPRWGEDRKDPC